MKAFLYTALLLIVNVTLYSQITYVSPDGAGLKDGTSWADALNGNSPATNGYTKLADAIRVANSGCQFWIAEGTYKASSDNDRNKSFEPAENINLYGGFVGNEVELASRNWVNNKTYLSGNIGDENLTTDNTYSVVKTSGSNWTLFSVIDGFCIVNGKADGQGWYTNKGGGIFNSQKLTINNCEISNCYASQAGGGAYNYGYGIIHISNTQFHQNSSYSGGGFCYGNSSNYAVTGAILTNCIISNNSGSGSGGISNGGVTEIRNCLIVNNTSTYYGGGLYATGSNTKTKVYNSTIANNSTNSQFVGGQAEIYNSIFWGNELSLVSNPILTVSSSCIQGYTSGTGVIDTNPLFIEPTAGNGIAFNGLTANWSLRWCSPCFETGNSSLVPSGVTTDLGGNPRILYSSVDMGAYELDTTGLTPNAIGFANNRIYVSDSTHYIGNGSNWLSAIAGNAESCKYPGQTLLYEAMKDAIPGTEIWVTKGVFRSTLGFNRSHAFTLADGVLLFGGFVGNESSIYQRDTLSKSVLSGNIGDTAQPSDNSYHILNINPNEILYNENAVIDGFKISNANANGTLNNSKGAGVYINSNSRVAISNSIIEVNNSTGNGAGIFINPNSQVVLNKCNILNNTSAASGAGIFNEGHLLLDYCKVNSNRYGSIGGGIYNSDSLLLSACEVDSNYTVATNSKAGGIYNSGFCRIVNSKITKNKSRLEAGGILNITGSTLELISTDVINNTCVMGYSDANGGGVANSGSISVVGS
ncbi:MAG: choice-of-anchor Q domain-containing protein, partial [Bacteroidales bacterium]